MGICGSAEVETPEQRTAKEAAAIVEVREMEEERVRLRAAMVDVGDSLLTRGTQAVFDNAIADKMESSLSNVVASTMADTMGELKREEDQAWWTPVGKPMRVEMTDALLIIDKQLCFHTTETEKEGTDTTEGGWHWQTIAPVTGVWDANGTYRSMPALPAHPDHPGSCDLEEKPQAAEIQVEFGEAMRVAHFCGMHPYFLNSASYGATPRAVINMRRRREDAFQANPVKWRFGSLNFRLLEARSRLASFIGTDVDWVQILPNANAASNTILKSLPWRAGDRILVFSVEYDATLHACEYLKRTYGVQAVTLDLVPPMSGDAVCAAVEAKLRQMQSEPGGLPVLCNFCHVTSKTAWVFPAQRLVRLLHRFRVSVLVDGAQAAGHLDLSVRDIDADWYVGTVHKWMYSCPGVAFLVTKPCKQACTFPQTVSYFDRQGYSKEFSYYGLQDWSTQLSLIDGLTFVDKVCGGWQEVRRYCLAQAGRVAGTCKKIWTEKGLKGPAWLANWPEPLQGGAAAGQMPIIPLPWHSSEDAAGSDAAKVMGSLMAEGLTAFVLVIPVRGSDGIVHTTLGIRCACQIYTNDHSWAKMAEMVSDFGGNYGALEVAKDLFDMLSGHT